MEHAVLGKYEGFAAIMIFYGRFHAVVVECMSDGAPMHESTM